MKDEFYIGYEPAMPPGLASRVRVVAAGLMAVALLLPSALVLAQMRFSSSVFEFGRERHFEGRIVEYPYPALQPAADSSGAPAASLYWLVGPGKHGAAHLVKGLDGQSVQLSGSLIHREGDAMIEIVPDSVRRIDSAHTASTEPLRTIGPEVVSGEIVDSKCHLGVMRPGEGATHRDCAVRCLLGNIPPMFAPRGEAAGLRRLPLVDVDGGTFTASLQRFVGKPVSIRGVLLERGMQRFLAASLSDIEVIGRQ